MWFEILPVMAIMTGCLCTPPVAAYFVHKLFQNGNVSIAFAYFIKLCINHVNKTSLDLKGWDLAFMLVCRLKWVLGNCDLV